MSSQELPVCRWCGNPGEKHRSAGGGMYVGLKKVCPRYDPPVTDDATPALSDLRQQIAEAIHTYVCHSADPSGGHPDCDGGADAVVALLNLTEEEADFHDEGPTTPRRHRRLVTPWLPSTPSDTSPEVQRDTAS